MTIFANKNEFLTLGVDAITPSAYQMAQDCTICLAALDLTPEDVANEQDHPAIRIKSCGHIHGKECLTAWLDVGNTCPTCKRMLFIPPQEQPITQEDVNAIIHHLGHWYDEDVLFQHLARYMHQADVEALRSRQQAETLIAMERLREEEQARKDREEAMLRDEDFMDTDADDGDLPWSDGEGEDEDVQEEDEEEEEEEVEEEEL